MQATIRLIAHRECRYRAAGSRPSSHTAGGISGERFEYAVTNCAGPTFVGAIEIAVVDDRIAKVKNGSPVPCQALDAFVVENDQDICGCSFVYKYFDSGNLYIEIGTVRITKNGFRLQQLLCQLHIVQMFLDEYYASTNITFAVVKPGTASEYILRNYVGS